MRGLSEVLHHEPQVDLALLGHTDQRHLAVDADAPNEIGAKKEAALVDDDLELGASSLEQTADFERTVLPPELLVVAESEIDSALWLEPFLQ